MSNPVKAGAEGALVVAGGVGAVVGLVGRDFKSGIEGMDAVEVGEVTERDGLASLVRGIASAKLEASATQSAQALLSL